ncbi:L,D-transpeptidase family protein [Bacillus sp. 1P10SD]|uniref:L,D-transpeptidase family protein n=1 Tax=Bacillus sp. 1P10SD TaxID=3132265 RepID=UPI0039A44823
MKKFLIFVVLLVSFFFLANQTDASGNTQLIIINKKTNTLAFYNAGKLVKTFKVATGRVSTYTPEGTFRIVNKIKNRPYYTKNIPGGDPRNPLGDRWMGLEARGTYGTTYGIHGNSNESSIGKYASSGCVRMHNAEIRWLFGQVQMYTTVIITRSNNSFDSIAKANGYGVTVSVNGTTSGDVNVNGWVQAGGEKYYYSNGSVKVGWQTISGKRYFFENSGVMKTGWLSKDGSKYYLDNNGVMQTGWLTLGEEKYYLDQNGVMKTGWLVESEKKYYLDQTGAMKTGWIEDNGNKYYLDNNGMMKTGWFTESGSWYYLDDTGAMKTGWLALGGKNYFLDNNGVMKTGWVSDGENSYFLDTDGTMKTGWINFEGKWCYLNQNGRLKSELVSTSTKSNNQEPVGSQKPSWLDYAFINSGKIFVTSWLNYQNKWYYLYVSGDMANYSKTGS